MANFTAKDVARLREETGAPMMEAKNALTEAEGDFERAKVILREKGKAAAGKRADRATSAGVVAVSMAHDHHSAGVVVLESETDFVARNEDFVALAQELAEIFLHNDPGDDPLAVKHGEHTVKEMLEAAVGKIRENIKLAQALHLKTDAQLASYVHHDRTKGAIIELTGEPEVRDAGRNLAIQVVAMDPEVVRREDLSQEKLAEELEVELKRAMEEGKPENIARNIAQGRVNKEFVKRAVLLEQDYYAEPGKTVTQYLSETVKGSEVRRFWNLKVGVA